MPKLPIISSKQLIKILLTIGFQIASQKGSHIKLIRQTSKGKQVLIVPNHKTIKPGTLKNGILRHIPMTVEELIKRMKS